MFQVPSEFELGGITWRVLFVDDMDEHGAYGICNYQKNIIKLDSELKEREDLLSVTFMHELMHAILHTMDHELADNESFVELVANFMVQVQKSAIYDEDNIETTELKTFQS